MRLQATSEGRAIKMGGECQGMLRPPFLAPETRREADAYSRAASRRGCTRHRQKPLAGEPRG